MFSQQVAIVALSALTLVSAQTNSTSPFTFANPSSIDIGDRVTWCTAEGNACSQLCTSVSAASCDENTLNYTCTCSNGQSPDMTQYMNTLPWFICEKNYQVCVANAPNDLGAQKACKTNYADKCGTKSLADATPIDASSSAGPSSTSAGSASGTAATTTATAKPGAAAPGNLQQAKAGAAVVFAAMAYML